MYALNWVGRGVHVTTRICQRALELELHSAHALNKISDVGLHRITPGPLEIGPYIPAFSLTRISSCNAINSWGSSNLFQQGFSLTTSLTSSSFECNFYQGRRIAQFVGFRCVNGRVTFTNLTKSYCGLTEEERKRKVCCGLFHCIA